MAKKRKRKGKQAGGPRPAPAAAPSPAASADPPAPETNAAAAPVEPSAAADPASIRAAGLGTLARDLLPWSAARRDRKRREDARRKALPGSLRRKESIEALAFALLLVLVVKYFSLEVFQIPTRSMEPTLIGRPAFFEGDRILVDRTVFRFEDPVRWDVVVFKYPLDRSKNYIKRLVGLPGERLAARGGDLFFDGRTAARPDRVQEAHWFPVHRDKEFRKVWNGDGAIEEDGWHRIDRAGDESVAASDYYRFDRDIEDEGQDGRSDTVPVGDVRLSMDVRLVSGEGHLSIVLSTVGTTADRATRAARTEWQLGPSICRARTEVDGEEPGPWATGDAALTPGRAARVEAISVDGFVRLVVDGRTVVEAGGPREHATARIVLRQVGLSFSPVAAEMAFRDVEVDRDLYYRSEGILAEGCQLPIPTGRYVLMGDNSANSRDSRLWSVLRIRTADDRMIEGDLAPGREVDGNPIGIEAGDLIVRDRNGFPVPIDLDDIRRIEIVPSTRPRPEGEGDLLTPGRYLAGVSLGGDATRIDESEAFFVRYEAANPDPDAPIVGIPLTADEIDIATVPRQNIIGRAYFVFWPVWRTEDGFRINTKFIE